MDFGKRHVFVFVFLLATYWSRPVSARTVVIDEQTPGTTYDAILDGYPGFFTQDGIPDAGNNNLAIAWKAGAVEMRSVAEFPLAGLAGVTASDVIQAKLRFNVDDVLGFLGAPLSGCAAENIAVWVRAGDGSIPVSDFIVSGPPTAVVNTGPPCSITDTTLGSSGPVVFEVDITGAVQTLVGGNVPFANVVWATNSDNTGTSLDNLGINSAGPPGVRGARMPYVVVELAELPPPSLDAQTRRCQAVLAARSQAFQQLTQRQLSACTNRVLADIAKGRGVAKAMDFCVERLATSGGQPSFVLRARQRHQAAIQRACASPALVSALGPPCDASVTDGASLAQCALDRAFEAAQRATRSHNALLCAVLTAVGLQTQYTVGCQQ
ncbi:MAG: hypothetical protein KatS3mg077_2204 [Candidatus Binatia bacterium]|nr:MAG: hypothetical protein KatS3mg077_2204 [Candidatus Binatia bacterium]